MSNPPDSDSPQIPTSAGHRCAACQADLGDSYYAANQAEVCANCASVLQQRQAPQGSRFGRLMKAVLFGGGAAAAGAILQYLVLHLFNLNAAIVTILIGFMVGKAVHAGSGNRGGWRYQVIAVVLTYLAIGAAYVPLTISELKAGQERKAAGLPDPAKFNAQNLRPMKLTPGLHRATPAPALEEPPSEPLSPVAIFVIALFGLFANPLIYGWASPLNILIFGFGLYQAWKMNKATQVQVTGPYWRNTPPLPT